MEKLFGHMQMSKKQWLMYLAGVVLVALLPLVIKDVFTQHVLCLILLWSIVGMGWNFLGGYAGQVSIGHAVFYGIGAYSSALMYLWFKITPWLGMWVGVVLSMVVAFLIGKPLLRLKGHYFAVATMATAECCRVIFVNLREVGGATGLDFLDKTVHMWYSMQFPTKLHYYYVFFGFAVLVSLVVLFLNRSRFGYYLRTIKGNEHAAESVGIDTANYKLKAYLLSAAIVSIGGSLYAQYMTYIDPTMLMTLRVSLMICLVTVMGGTGKPFGPVVGGVVLTLISEYTRSMAGGTGSGIDQIIYGVLVVIVVLLLPNGILSLFQRKRRAAVPAAKEGKA